MLYILQNSRPAAQPRVLVHNGRRIVNPTPRQLSAAGYMPLVTADAPESDETVYAAVYAAQDGKIVQSWVEVVPETEPVI